MRKRAILSLILLSGCKPEPLKLADQLDRSSSWLAAVAEVGTRTAQNRTPIRFADDVIADASDELTRVASRLASLKIAPDIRDGGRRLILASSPRLDQLRADLDAGTMDVHGNLAWLKSAADTLSDLSDRARKLKQ
jgi:hypothetical protein